MLNQSSKLSLIKYEVIELNIKFSDKEIENIKNLYIEDKYSYQKIGDIYKCSRSTISRLLKKNNISNNIKSDYKASITRKHNLNENYFSEINSKTKAYILGLIVSDGNISSGELNNIKLFFKNNSCCSELNVIKDIIKDMEYTGDYKIVSRKDREGTSIELIISSKKLKEDLIKLGILPNKTFQMSIENICKNIPNEYISDFILGYFDGDGCFSFSKRKDGYIAPTFNITLPTENAYELIRIMNFDFKFTISIDKRTDGKICQIKTGSKKNIFKIYKYLYKDKTIFFKRKKDKFLKFFELIGELQRL